MKPGQQHLMCTLQAVNVCRYCQFRSVSYYAVREHEREAHHDERLIKAVSRSLEFVWYLVLVVLAALIAIPLLDYVVVFWLGK